MEQDSLFDTKPPEARMKTARHLMALEGFWGQTRDEIGKAKFDKLVEQETVRLADSLPDIILNSEPAYGVTEEDLVASFDNSRIGNYEALENMLIGLNNADVPHKILAALNSSELLALYLGIGQLKKQGSIRYGMKNQRDIPYTELIEKGFEEQISLLISYGYRRRGIRVMRERGFTSHPNKRGQLRQRMSKIDSRTREQFRESLGYSLRMHQKQDRESLIKNLAYQLSEVYERNTKR